MRNLLQDLSTLTTIGKYNLDDLSNKSIAIISNDVLESILDHEEVTCIDVGIGILYIQHIEDCIRYKFVPSKKMEEAVINTCNSKKSVLTAEIDEALGQRIMNTYKDLF